MLGVGRRADETHFRGLGNVRYFSAGSDGAALEEFSKPESLKTAKMQALEQQSLETQIRSTHTERL